MRTKLPIGSVELPAEVLRVRTVRSTAVAAGGRGTGRPVLLRGQMGGRLHG